MDFTPLVELVSIRLCRFCDMDPTSAGQLERPGAESVLPCNKVLAQSSHAHFQEQIVIERYDARCASLPACETLLAALKLIAQMPCFWRDLLAKRQHILHPES